MWIVQRLGPFAGNPTIPLPKHRHRIAGEFGIVSDKMKAAPIRLGDDEAIEGIAVEGGKRRQGEDVFQGNRLQYQSILVLLTAKHISQRQTQAKFAELQRDL